jgi:hypothetical protein
LVLIKPLLTLFTFGCGQLLERVRVEQERKRTAAAALKVTASPKLQPTAGGAGQSSVSQIPAVDALPPVLAAVGGEWFLPPHVVCSLFQTLSQAATMPGSYSRFQTDFEVLGKLGKGGFGEVVKARNKLDGVVYAIKIIKVRRPTDDAARVSCCHIPFR